MKILIDLGHPGHVHLFKNLISILKSKDINSLITVRDLPAAKALLDLYKIPYIEIGNKSDSIKGKFVNQLKYDMRLRKIVVDNNIELAIGTSITIAHVSKISKAHSIVFDDDDDEVQPLMTKFGHPFADLILSPDSLINKRKKKETIYYAGYHELAYLHPNRFSPDATVLKEAGLKEGEKYFVLRFNAFKAHHDIGIKGISTANKQKLVKLLLNYGKVFITSERELETEFEEYRIKIPPHKIHSFIYYSTMFLGDSQTMTSEAAILGVPALKCNSFAGELSVPNEIENTYGLCYAYKPENFDKMLMQAEELLKNNDLKKEWLVKKENMLKDKIDVTGFLLWFIEGYPNSIKELKNNPDLQYQFK